MIAILAFCGLMELVAIVVDAVYDFMDRHFWAKKRAQKEAEERKAREKYLDPRLDCVHCGRYISGDCYGYFGGGHPPCH